MSKKDTIKKRHNNMVSLILFALAASSLFLSVTYASMTSNLRITGNATVETLSYPTVYYYNSTFYSNEACTTPAKDKAGSNITKLSTMVPLIKNSGIIYMKSQYTTTASETITTNNNVKIERYTGSTNGPYTSHLIKTSGSANTFTISTSGIGHIILDGHREAFSNDIAGRLIYVNGAQFKIDGNVTFQNNACWGENYHGGAVVLDSSGNFSSLPNSKVTFSNNQAYRGGAIGISNSHPASTINLAGTVNFSNNKALAGGAIYLPTPSVANLTGNVTFTGNKTTSFTEPNLGGAILNSGYMTLSGTVTLDGNTAYNGGAIYSEGPLLTLSGTVTIRSNYAVSKGGGLYLNWQSVANYANVYIQCVQSGPSAALSGTVTFSNNVDASSESNRSFNVFCFATSKLTIFIPEGYDRIAMYLTSMLSNPTITEVY